jgi:hypothetical protein
MKKILLISTILVIFISCDLETVVDLDIPDHDPVLVINSLLDSDSTIRVFVSHSVGAFSNITPSSVNDANVLLYENDQFVDSLFVDWSDPTYFNYYSKNNLDSILVYYYKSDIVANVNSTYRLEVNHPSYKSVSATTSLPNDVELFNVRIDTTSFSDKINLSFNFNDNQFIENYYGLRIFSSCHKNFNGEEFEYKGIVEFASNDPSFPSGIPFDGYTFTGFQVLFNDALFNGMEKRIELDVLEDYFEFSDCDTLLIQFSVFSDQAYSYYTSRDQFRENGPSGVFGGEVVPVFTNVENGLGILMSLNTQNIIIKN